MVRSSRTAALTLNVSMFLVMAGFGVILPILPYFARDMGATPLEMALLTSVFAFTQFIMGPVWGDLSDRYGRRLILIGGMVGYGLSFIMLALSTTVPTLMFARALGGLVSSAAFPVELAIAADSSSPEDRAAAIGTLSASQNLGFIFGPMIGGVLAPLGVFQVFTMSGAAVLITAAATAFVLREPARGPDPERVSMLNLFRSLPRALTGRLGGYLLVTLGATFGGSSVFAMFAFYLMDRIGASAAVTGYVFTSMGIGSAAVQYLAVGRLTRLLGEKNATRLALGTGTIAFAILAAGTTMTVLIIGSLTCGLSLGLLRPVVATALSRRTPYGQGFTMGLNSSFDSLGRMIGPLWAGSMYGYGITIPFWLASAIFALLIAAPRLGPAASAGEQTR